jgi:uncharacterized NAD(P)/FAD-binding protein YdhS
VVSVAEVDVAIVGGGASGALLCVHLARLGRRPSVAVVESDPAAWARGVAYRDDAYGMWLNARADRMSALPGDPGDFARAAGVAEDAFAPRSRYGDYLAARFGEAERALGLRRVAARAIDLSEEGELHFDRGGSLRARAVVLAMGNLPPRLAASLGAPDAPSWPWQARTVEAIGADDSVVVLGAGLSFFDLATTLLGRGHRGRLTALSRHGLLPAPHGPAVAAPPPPPRGLVATLRWLRGRGEAWREAIDALRPDAQAHWQALTPTERDAFDRHLRPFWSVHRHRAPRHLWDVVRAAQRRGQLDVMRGRPLDAGRRGGRVVVGYEPRGGGVRAEIEADALVDCSGPTFDASERFVGALLERGLVERDAKGPGLKSDAAGRVTPTRARFPLYAIGPVRRGGPFETTGVREIALQAEALAALLGAGL